MDRHREEGRRNVSETFEERLEQSRRTPLMEGLSKYGHIERLGNSEVEGLLSGDVVVTEKLDGANASVALMDGRFVIASRNRVISVAGEPPTGFDGLVEYVLAHDGIRALLAARPNWILRGEFLLKHSLSYDVEAYRHIYVFDVQDRDRPFTTADGMDYAYLHPDEYLPSLQEHGIRVVPEVARLTNPSVDELIPLSQGASALGPEREGVVVKRYDFRNAYGRAVWGKLVSADFKEKNKMTFGAGKDDPAELRFASRFCTQQFVLKTLHTVAEGKGEAPRIQHMGGVLRKSWRDLFMEELFDFVMSEKVGTLDFKALQKLVEAKTKDVALSFYNGVPSIRIGPKDETSPVIEFPPAGEWTEVREAYIDGQRLDLAASKATVTEA